MKKARKNGLWESGRKVWLDWILVDQTIFYLEVSLFSGEAECLLRPCKSKIRNVKGMGEA